MPMKKKSVQIVLVSDNHGSREPLEYVRRTHADADSFIHCGDVELPTYLVDGFAVVQGNNDNYQQFPARRIIELGEHRIYVCHGHRDMFFGHFDMLSEKAKAERRRRKDATLFSSATHIFRLIKPSAACG